MIKEKYLKLLKHLRKNARTPLSNIAKTSGTPISTLHDRLKITEKYILKHTSLLNYTKLGYSLHAKILLYSNNIEKLEEFILPHKNINSAYILDGNFNFLIECIFKNMKDFKFFLNELSLLPLLSKEIFFVNQDIKKEVFLS